LTAFRFPDYRTSVARLLFIVSRNELRLFDELRRSFEDISGVQVMFDRRAGERRRGTGAPEAERRHAQRRATPYLETHLQTMGWAVAHLT
jgi:hypothetical protein